MEDSEYQVSFRFVEGIATADCAVEIQAESPEAIFEDAAVSMMSRMTELRSIKSCMKWEVAVEDDSLERLLYGWLSELVYIRDSENVLFSEFEIDSLEIGQICRLRATVKGERIDHERHDIAVDIKAVTMHMLRIQKEASGWSAFVIFDL
jgi:SHS2 domain-containing protein